MSLPVHPALVHLPLGLAMVMPLVAAGLTWAVWKNRLPRSALAVVAGLQLVLAATALMALKAGRAEEKQAARVAPREAIHEHEEMAENLVWLSVAVLVVAGAALLVPARRAPLLGALVTAGALAGAVLAVLTGEKGGELVFHHGAAVEKVMATAPPPAADAKDDD